MKRPSVGSRAARGEDDTRMVNEHHVLNIIVNSFVSENLNSPDFYTLQVGKFLVDSFQDTFLKLGKLDNPRDLKGVALVSQVNLVH